MIPDTGSAPPSLAHQLQAGSAPPFLAKFKVPWLHAAYLLVRNVVSRCRSASIKENASFIQVTPFYAAITSPYSTSASSFTPWKLDNDPSASE